MKTSKASVVLHLAGFFFLLLMAVAYSVIPNYDVLLLGLIGMTFTWLLALERDVYAKEKKQE